MSARPAAATLLPDPEPRERHHTIISVDDHLVEPADLFEQRLPAALRAAGPRVVETDDGDELWEFEGRRIGLAICEDVWSGEFWGPDPRDVTDSLAELCEAGAELLLVVSASPWEQGKGPFREAMLRDASRRHAVPIVFCNLVGGNVC